jgi:hypothetical protein
MESSQSALSSPSRGNTSPDSLSFGEFDDKKAPRYANISDTSEMIYLGGDKGWVRMDLLSKAVGDPVPPPGQRAEHKINNGITGDARRSSAELGKRYFDMKVEYAVNQIHRSLGDSKSAAQR